LISLHIQLGHQVEENKGEDKWDNHTTCSFVLKERRQQRTSLLKSDDNESVSLGLSTGEVFFKSGGDLYIYKTWNQHIDQSKKNNQTTNKQLKQAMKKELRTEELGCVCR